MFRFKVVGQFAVLVPNKREPPRFDSLTVAICLFISPSIGAACHATQRIYSKQGSEHLGFATKQPRRKNSYRAGGGAERKGKKKKRVIQNVSDFAR